MLSLLLFSTQLWAATLNCEFSVNSQRVHTSQVDTVLSQKVPVGRTQQVVAYITEKQNSIFMLEAYLENQEARIYSQGYLNRTGEALLLAFWSREELLEVSCKK